MAASEPHTYTLHYFVYYGRGEPIRMALTYFGLRFTEVSYEYYPWLEVKSSGLFEFQQIPILIIDKKSYVQSHAIMRYLCMKNGAYPTDVNEIARVEAIADLRAEIYDQVMPFMYFGKVEEAKAWYRANFPNKYLPMIEKLLQANRSVGQGKYFVGAKVTMADFFMFEMGYNDLLRPLLTELGREFRPTAPLFFTFLDTFPSTNDAFKRYMEAYKERPF